MCHRLHVEDFEAPFHFRRRFAATMGLSSDAFRIAPATPTLANVAVSGVPCRAVVALCESPRQSDAIVILDCRAIREGIRAMIVPFAHLVSEQLLLELQDEAPPGWSPVILPAISHHAASPVVSGQVLTVIYRTSSSHRDHTVAPETQPDARSTPAASSSGLPSPPFPATSHGADNPTSQADIGADEEIDDAPAAPTQSGQREQQDVQIVCVVLVPTYKPEVHTLHMHFPSTVILTCAALSAARADLKWLHFPTLIPVYPQPDFDGAYFIARPHFPTETVTVVFDTRAVDGRLFAMSLPPVVDRLYLLSAAQLDHRAFLQVYHRDLPWALPDAQTVYLSDGDLICVCSVDIEVSVLVSLEDRLSDPHGWASPGHFSLETPEAFWVLAVRQRFWLPAAAEGPVNLRAGIANRLRVDASDLCIVPAHMPLRDVAFVGWPACALLAAEVPDEPIAPPSANDVFYFLDKRPLHLDVIWAAARDGIADLTAARASLATRCPQGYSIHFRGGTPLQGDRRRVFSGEVIIVEFLQANIPQIAIPVPDPGGRGPGGDQGGDPAHPISTPTGQTTSHVATAAAADTGGTHTSSSAGSVFQVSTSIALPASPRASLGAPRKGRRPFRKQPFASATCCAAAILGMVICLSHARLCGLGVFFTLYGSFGGPLRLPWLLAAGCMLSDTAAAMPEYTFEAAGPGSTLGCHRVDLSCDDSSSGRHTRLYVRPVATPCRSLPCPSAERPPVVPPSWQYTTLLEHSCREAAGKPLYEACTLLEVLHQHFATSTYRLLPSKDFQCPASRQTLSLQSLIPSEDTSHGAFPLLLPSRSVLAWPALPTGITPDEFVTIGQTHLGFTMEQLQRFFSAPAPLLTWQQAISILPLFRREAESSWPAFLTALRCQCLPNDLWAFTDGSYTPAGRQGLARAGWAVVFVDPSANAFAITLGPVPSDAASGTSVNAYLAECQALTAAALVGIASFSHRRILFVSDCTAAIDAAAGRCGYQLRGLPHTLASVHTFRKQVCDKQDAYIHVPGHAGILGNEWADRASKLGATLQDPFRGLLTSPEDGAFWLDHGGVKLPWAALAVRSLRGDPTVPPVFTQAVGNNHFHAGLTSTQILEPFLPPGALDVVQASVAQAADVLHHLHIAAVTFNVLSLGGKADANPAEDVTEGLAFRPARATLLADQLYKHGVNVAFLQETRAETGTTRAGRYLRFIAGANRGQHGTEIWFADGQPILQGTAPAQGKDTFVTPALVVVHQDPRRLLIRFSGKSISVLFVSLHGPHRATERAAIEHWWQQTENLLQQHARQSHVLIGGDMNASLGSITSRHVGPVAPEDEDTAGEYLHRLSKTYNLCFPSTMDHCHTGPSHTYVQKNGGQLCRPDFVAVPIDWTAGNVSSYTAPDIHAAHSTPDHIAAFVQARATFRAPQVRTRLSRRILPIEALTHPSNRDAITQVLREVPVVNWNVSVHAHAAILTRHVQDGLAKVSQHAQRRPHHPYLSDATWELQGRVACLRRALHRLTDVASRSDLASGFYAWRQGSPISLIFAQGRLWFLRAQRIKFSLHRELRALCKQLRKACRRDRDCYISELAHTIATAPTKEAFAAYHRVLAHRRKKAFRLEPLPGILKADGDPCADAIEVQQRWRQHFAGLEAALTRNSLSLLNAHRPQVTLPVSSTHWMSQRSRVCPCFAGSLQAPKVGKLPVWTPYRRN